MKFHIIFYTSAQLIHYLLYIYFIYSIEYRELTHFTHHTATQLTTKLCELTRYVKPCELISREAIQNATRTSTGPPICQSQV